MSVSETLELNSQEDAYADRTVVMCETCHLPKTVVTYELGFQLLQQQLSELKEQLQQALNKIDLLEHK